jgi:two-component system CheB/CheR fusion protein
MVNPPKSAHSESAPVEEPAPSEPHRATDTFPIVGIGASAGGLEAIEQFLKSAPIDSGIAFVVVQHMDPTHKGMLPELLQRVTKMPVLQAASRMKVKPNCVYVIPPNKDLSILRGVLHPLEPNAPRGLRLPIDFFLRALAEDQRELAIGVILSGMGSDGTLGIRTIKEHAGLTLVQEPASAKFDSMPRSAIDAGLADFVDEASQLPAKIISYLRSVRPLGQPEPVVVAKEEPAVAQIVILLRQRTGNDFSQYKKNTLYRRIERRMGLHRIKEIERYVGYLRQNSKEIDLLCKELLIGVTKFFREPAVWDYLRDSAIPALLANSPAGTALRAWIPACSTGEEAYSLAIVFREAIEKIKPKAPFSLRIFATDLDQDAIDKARQGYFPSNIGADVSPARLARFFNESGSGYRIGKEVREMVIFAPQNIITDAPFIKLDIITCRNLLIYFDVALQRKLIPLFHYALNSSGFLLLGASETASGFSALLKPLDNKMRLYRRIETGLPNAIEFPTKTFPGVSKMQEERSVTQTQTNFQSEADQFLLQNLSPAAVLVDAEGNITYFNGRTGAYLEPAAGKANLNVYAMAREGLRHKLAAALKTITHAQGRHVLENLQVVENSGAVRNVSVTLQAIEKPESLRGMVMISFVDAGVSKADDAVPGMPSAEAQLVIERMQTEVRAMQEEMQSSKEELTSANEEMQSMNEELQSANEELTTSKEELQSLNEELQTVNAELQSRVDDLSSVNSDLKNLLNSTEIATVFLDSALSVRRFTDHATSIFKLIPSDVGRPLSDIANELHYPGLLADSREVLQTLMPVDKQISAEGARWFKIRIMPYRTLENVIDGVVITLSDITAFKTLEAKLRDDLLPSAEVGEKPKIDV